jgi:membrane protein implicated in regulation of membrane protease activity
MAELTAESDSRSAETLPALGLILNMVAVIAFALCLAGFAGTTSLWLAVAAGAVALLSFAGSLAVLIVDGKRFARPGSRRRKAR